MAFGFHTTAEEVVQGIDLSGKLVVLTGASSGIGIETAKALCGAGASLVLGVRDVAKGREAADSISSVVRSDMRVEELDLRDPRSGSDRWRCPRSPAVRPGWIRVRPCGR